MLRIEVSLPPDLTAETFTLWLAKPESEREPGDVVLSVVVLKCEYCKAPFVQCKKEHRFCKNPNCRKYAHRDKNGG